MHYNTKKRFSYMLNNYNCYNNISLTSKYSRASLKTENKTMNEDRFTSQNAWYHFVLDDIVDAIRLYGYDVVMTDIVQRYNQTLSQVEHFHD